MTAPSNESTHSIAVPSCEQSGICSGRRAVLGGAAAIGALGLLAACGGGGSSDTAEQPAPAAGNGTGGNTTGETAAGTPEPSSGAASGGTVLGPTSDVPVGGGKTFNDKIVVTQPTAGEYKAFSAVCTHTGCIVYDVANGSIKCGCHGSRFSDKDGSVQQGPAKAPLTAVNVTVDGDTIKLA